MWTSVAAAVSSVAAAPRLQGAGSVVVTRGLSCPEASGIFPDQGSNQCLLNCKADFQPLDQQGSPESFQLIQNYVTEGGRKIFIVLISLCSGENY